MNELNVNFDALGEVSSVVGGKGEEFNELLSRIKTYNEELRNAWEGTDASKYTEAVARQAETMQKLGDAIIEISAFLKNVNTTFQEAQEDNRSKINY